MKEEHDRQERLAERAIEAQRRSDERAIEAQRRISETETKERRRIATAAAVSALSQRLIDIVISQRNAPEHAVEDARILMSLPDFRKHFSESELWPVVAANACLKQAYFETALATLLKGGCPDDVVQLIREHRFLKDSAMRWLREEAGDNWRRVGVSAYERVLIAINQLDQEDARLLEEQNREQEREERRQRVERRWQRVFAVVKDAVVIVGLLLVIFWVWNWSSHWMQRLEKENRKEGFQPTEHESVSRHQTDGAVTSDTPDVPPVEIRRALPAGQQAPPLKPFYDLQRVTSFVVSGLKLNDPLNVRTGPSAKHPVVATLLNGKRGIQIVGEPVQNGETLWVPVRFEGVDGWVNRQFLVEE